MILRILLGVACLSLFNTSQAEAQLLRRLRILPQVQSRFQPQQQPQRYVPQTVAPQNGYQGRLTASQPQSAYVRRPDGLVGRYAAQQPTQVQRVQVPNQVQRVQVPNQVQRVQVQRVQVPTQIQRVQVPTQIQRVQVPTQIQRFPTARLSPAQTQAVATTNRQLRPNVVQGQLIPVRPTTQIPRQFGNAYLRLPVVQPPAVAPVGISVLNQTRLEAQQLQAQQLQAQQTQAQQTQAQQLQTLNNSILPAIEMPEAIVSLGEPASSIPISSAPTNPAPRGLSLSLDDDDLVPASAEVEVEPATEAEAVLDSNGKKTFSVLETIE